MTPMVGWTQSGLFHGIPGHLVQDVLAMCQSHCSGKSFVEPDYLMIRGGLEKFPDVEEGIVKPLSLEHTALIIANWKFAHAGSELWIKEQIRRGMGYGVFFDGQIQPISWGLCYP